MDIKEILGLIAVALGLYSYLPYFTGILRGKIHPHLFSWLIWGLLTAIGFAAQLSDNAGPGAWVSGVSVVACVLIAMLCLRYGEKRITRSDWVFLAAGLAAIPLWAVTQDPLWSVILITGIDALGFYPTIRKSWIRPFEESVTMFALSGLKFAFAFAALENVSLVTGLYIGSLVVMNWGFVLLLLLRRRMMAALA